MIKLSDYEKKIVDPKSMIDILMKTLTTTNTDLTQLCKAVRMSYSTSKSYGLDLEQTCTAIAKLSNAGIRGNHAGKIFSALLSALISPKGQTREWFEIIGIKATNEDGYVKPLPQLVGHINLQLSALNKEMAVSKLVGRELAKAMIVLLEVGEKDLEEYLESLYNSEGEALELAQLGLPVTELFLGLAQLPTDLSSEGIS